MTEKYVKIIPHSDPEKVEIMTKIAEELKKLDLEDVMNLLTGSAVHTAILNGIDEQTFHANTHRIWAKIAKEESNTLAN